MGQLLIYHAGGLVVEVPRGKAYTEAATDVLWLYAFAMDAVLPQLLSDRGLVLNRRRLAVEASYLDARGRTKRHGKLLPAPGANVRREVVLSDQFTDSVCDVAPHAVGRLRESLPRMRQEDGSVRLNYSAYNHANGQHRYDKAAGILPTHIELCRRLGESREDKEPGSAPWPAVVYSLSTEDAIVATMVSVRDDDRGLMLYQTHDYITKEEK